MHHLELLPSEHHTEKVLSKIHAYLIASDLSNWAGKWKHYSKHPMLTVNPHPVHMDPAGIYFFPEEHTPKFDIWQDMPYTYYAMIKPNSNVLDVAHITDQQIDHLIKAAGIEREFAEHIAKYPPKDIHDKFDKAWDDLQRHYFLTLHRKQGAFNAMLRKAGYDAIFDDTGTIHSEEPQLLVLNRKIINNIHRTDKHGSGFSAMKTVLEDLKNMGLKFSDQVEIGKIKKPGSRASFYDKDALLKSSVTIGNAEYEEGKSHPHAIFEVYIDKAHPNNINIHLLISEPRLNYGVGNEYSIPKGEYRTPLSGAAFSLEKELKNIFPKPELEKSKKGVEEWWEDLDEDGKRQYQKDHPGGRYAYLPVEPSIRDKIHAYLLLTDYKPNYLFSPNKNEDEDEQNSDEEFDDEPSLDDKIRQKFSKAARNRDPSTVTRRRKDKGIHGK